MCEYLDIWSVYGLKIVSSTGFANSYWLGTFFKKRFFKIYLESDGSGEQRERKNSQQTPC